MRQATRHRYAAAVAALLLLPCLSGCDRAATDADTRPPIDTVEQDTPPAGTSGSDASDADLRAYYEVRIKALEDAILTMKQEQYVTNTRYNARLEALEAALHALSTGSGDRPTGGTPSDTAPPDTSAPDTSVPPTDPTTPPAGTPSADTDFRYEVRGGEAVIVSYVGTEQQVVVPSAIAGCTVRGIADNAFAGTGVRGVSLPDTLKEIGWFAFYGCTELDVVSLPASVEVIGYGAFDLCPNLTVHCPAGSYAAAYAASFGIPTVVNEV